MTLSSSSDEEPDWALMLWRSERALQQKSWWNVSCGGRAAVVTATFRQKFTYGTTANDDMVLFSYTLTKSSDGSWKIAHGHRATGQKPKGE